MNAPTASVPQLLSPQEVSVFADTREILAHAKRDARQRNFQDWLICDIDAHHFETVSWKEIIRFIEDPVVREQAMHFMNERVGAPPYGLNGDLALRYQSVGGRISHQDGQRETVTETDVHRDVTLTRRAMESLAIDYMVVFPTPMLFLGMHPQPEMEVWLSRAYNRWLIDKLLSADDRIKSLVYVPFNTPVEAERVVQDFANETGVIGFCVPSTRYKPVHHNDYMRLYAMIQETGKPLAFVWCNLVHITNWICNGIPERFPKLKSIWVESGLAWVPFLMQRLDDQYLMRMSEAPQLKRLPSEYMREHCWYTTQPMEITNQKALQCTLEMINAETQLLFASDWPHFDFDLPSTIWDLPFLSEQAKRNILGLNAARIFGLDPTPRKTL